ncbi:unnamed protein product, partial [Brassica rapa subsp. trilocularis]
MSRSGSIESFLCHGVGTLSGCHMYCVSLVVTCLCPVV